MKRIISILILFFVISTKSQSIRQIDSPNNDWKLSEEKPKTNINELDSKNFFSAKNLRFIEQDGQTVLVTHDSDLWLEKYEDRTSSKFELKKTSDSTFVLKFIESNNKNRDNLSIKGQEYKYGIYGKGQNYYSVWVLSEEGKYYLFKIYLD